MKETYIIPEPADPYAVRIIELMFYKFGLRPICLFSNRKKGYYLRRDFPILMSDMIEATYCIPDSDLVPFVKWLKLHYRILGVMSYVEFAVDVVSKLVDCLELDWNSKEVLLRFRDKNAMKSYIQQKRPDLNMPESHIVNSTDQILSHAKTWDKLVLKPNDGTGNTDVGIYRTPVSAQTLQAHMDSNPSCKWVLEEFVEGKEFAINGHVGDEGKVIIEAVFGYGRTYANGRDAMYVKQYHIKQTTPEFNTISNYAKSVITALELRHSPFHMEVIVDDKGPRLIDLGARLEGNDGAYLNDWLHPEKPTCFEIASHAYLFRDGFGIKEPDWTTYNRMSSLQVFGIAERDEIINQLEGIKEVENLPTFTRWYIKPAVGKKIHRTLDLTTLPYMVILLGEVSDEKLEEDEEFIRETIKWNTHDASNSSLARAIGYGSFMKDKLVPKLSWYAHRYMGYHPLGTNNYHDWTSV